MIGHGDPRFVEWLRQLEERQLADLTFPELSRALRALSATYVERRSKLGEGAALAGAGKRAAFALFYGPLHFLLARHIADGLPDRFARGGTIVDLGCGTGAAGAAWALSATDRTEVIGIDRHSWAIEEARRTYRAFGLRARVRSDDMTRVAFPEGSLVLAAFALNELDVPGRRSLLERFLAHANRRGKVVIIEPLAGFVAPWWKEWQRTIESCGGEAREWRLRTPLPAIVEKLDRAAGLDHREITGRTLSL